MAAEVGLVARGAARVAIALIGIAAACLVEPRLARAQAIQTNLHVTDGIVYDVVATDSVVYIGGSFSQVGPPSGGAVPLDITTGEPMSLPQVRGAVFAVAADGGGGWYLGGSFTHVGGVPRSNLAHIRSDHSLSPWNPNANGIVNALAVIGPTVYAGGTFTTVGGQFRRFAARLDSATSLATSWNPNPDGAVRALAVSGGTVYAGGGFTTIGGETRFNIAALDTATGLATSWDTSADGFVNALVVNEVAVYAGGEFTSMGGQFRSYVAALDLVTGAPTPWDPMSDGVVHALALFDNLVYVGGEFTDVGGMGRVNIAALSATTGLATTWNPIAAGPVRALAAYPGTVFAGGDFVAIHGQPRRHIAALSAATGVPTAWDPKANGPVHALAVGLSRVLAGGEFTSLGGLTRNNLAALSTTTGAPTPWDPDVDGVVLEMEPRGNTLYVGGSFLGVGGQARSRLAAVDLSTGVVDAWNPSVDIGVVTAVCASGNTVYVGGNFYNVGGQPRSNIAALDATTGLPTAWNPGADNYVKDLVASAGTIYAGGDFSTIGGQPRNRIAALDTAGVVTTWNPDAQRVRLGSNTASVTALALDGNTVYAGGSFDEIGGQPRPQIAALDATTGLATAWNPDARNTVMALAVSGATVYAGGEFDSIGGQRRERIAALDAATGLARTWNPGVSLNFVLSIALHGETLYAAGLFQAVDVWPRSGIAAIAMAPEIAGVAPDRGGDGGAATVTIAGNALQAGATAVLERAGETDIAGTQVQVAADGRSLVATFDLAGAAAGAWDVIVMMPDAQKTVLAGGFTVESNAPYEIRVTVLGPAMVRPNRRRAFDVVLENLGNTDVPAVPLWISRIPSEATVELDFATATPPREAGEPDWSLAPAVLDGPGGKFMAVVVPRLPPGATVRRLYLTVPNTVSHFELDAALAPPWANGEVLRACLAGGGAVTAPACVGAELDSIGAWLASTPAVQTLNGTALWAKAAWVCEGAGTLPAAVDEATQILNFMLQPIEGAAVPADCEAVLVPRWQDRRQVAVVTSVDPNDKLGSASRLIGGEQLMPYSIRFENLETATAPAQEVMVIDALDTATLDPATVSLGPITFSGHTVVPPPGLGRYTTEVDMRPARNVIVRVAVNLDRATGIIGWSLTSIDPATGQLPEDPQSGFLPPNVTPPEGEGSVLFTVMPMSGLTGGTAIRNCAVIDFDGIPLVTPEWENLLDITPPESAILPLGAVQDSASFTVRWGAMGAAPDLRDYSVYVSENDGSYRPWRVHTTATADTIAAPGGRSYSFYSLARDSSGNLEPVPPSPDVETYSRVAVDERAPLALALEGAAPNPAMGGEARVWFTLPSAARATLEVVDVAGRRVMRREVGALGPGRHAVDVGAAARAPGLYFVRLAQGGRSLVARMAVVR